MTERERWVVYPLLFLVLGASLRDRVGSSTSWKSIQCEELRIVDPDSTEVPRPRILVELGHTNDDSSESEIGYLHVAGAARIDGPMTVQGEEVGAMSSQLFNGLLRRLRQSSVQPPRPQEDSPPRTIGPEGG